MVWHHVEIARWIGVLIIDGRRNPLSIQRKRAKRRFDCAGRAERMRVIALGPAYGNAPCVIAEHLFNRRRFRAVVELCRTGVRVDVIDLLRRAIARPRALRASRECTIRRSEAAWSCGKRRCLSCTRALPHRCGRRERVRVPVLP